MRLLAAAAILGTVLLVSRMPRPTRAVVLGASLYGVVFFGGNFALTYAGLQEAPPATASVINASVPLLASAWPFCTASRRSAGVDSRVACWHWRASPSSSAIS